MSESLFESAEYKRISDEQAVEALRKKETDSISRALFEQWLDQSQAEIDKIYETRSSEAAVVANIKYDLKLAVVYYRAGFLSEAIVILEGTCDATGSKIFNGLGLYEEACELLRRMKNSESV